MLKKTIASCLLASAASLSAQIYECIDAQGARVWTNQPCANGTILHGGVSPSEQHSAERADQLQRTQRAKDNAAAAERFRQNAYDAPRRASSKASNKNLERCETSRRSLRIELSKMKPDRERLRQLRSDERQYC